MPCAAVWEACLVTVSAAVPQATCRYLPVVWWAARTAVDELPYIPAVLEHQGGWCLDLESSRKQRRDQH